MSGFDPTRFIDAEAAVAKCSQPVDGVELTPHDPETGEIRDIAAGDAAGVAAVAGVAGVDKLVGVQWADQLSRFLAFPQPPWLSPNAWRRLCADVRQFAVLHGDKAVGLGWLELELWGTAPKPWRRGLGCWGVVSLLNGRPVGEINAASIEIVNRSGPSNRYFRSPGVTMPSLPLWVAFNPLRWPVEGGMG